MTRNWKRAVACLMAALMLAGCLAACTPGDETEATTQPTTEPVTTPTTEPTIVPTEPSVPVQVTDPTLPMVPSVTGNTEVEQLRMSGYHENWVSRFETRFGACVTVTDTEALSQFWTELAQLEKENTLPQGYDDAFFAENYLVLIPMQSGSGSVRYEAEVKLEGQRITISVAGKMPEAGTADMADWLLLVPLARDAYPMDYEIEVLSGNSAVNDPDLNITDR